MYDHLGLHEDTLKVHHRFLINNIANNFEIPNTPLRGVTAAFLHAGNYQYIVRVPEYGRYDQTSSILPGMVRTGPRTEDGGFDG